MKRVVLFTSALAIAVYALHYDVLTVPPAIEQARGLWLQAAYLADTNFDYRRLETEEPGPEQFSAYSYERFKTSLPTLLAGMMRVLPSPQAVIVAYRLLTFLAAALTAALVFDIVRPHTGRLLGLLLVVAMLTNPVFSVQTEMLGMEIPLALASVGVAWCLASGRVGWSAVCALAAVVVKMSGAIAPLALLGSVALVAASGRGWKSKFFTWSGVLLVGALLYAVLARLGAHRNQFLWNDLRSGAPVLCPDLVFLMGITLAVWPLALLQNARGKTPTGNGRVNRSRVGLYCGLFIALQVMACENVSFLVRYLTAAIPLLFILLGMAASHVRWAVVTVAVALLVWNAGNRDGRWLPDLESWARGSSAFPFVLERSREYLDDHDVRLQFVRAAAQHSQGRAIITEYPYGYLLSVPRLGWVDEPAHGFSLYHRSPYYSRFRDFAFESAPGGLIPADGWFASVEHPTGSNPLRPSTLARKVGRDLPPAEPEDVIAFEMTSGQRYMVFSKHWHTEPPTSDASLRRWAIDSGWSGVTPNEPHLEDVLHFRLDVLLALGLTQRALREWDAMLTSDDLQSTTRLACLGLLASRFPPGEVWNRCYRHAQAFPAEPYGWAMCGAVALRGGDLPLAARMFDETLQVAPDNIEGLAGAGIVRALSGHIAAAEEYLQRALALLPPERRDKRAELLRWMGKVRLRQNRPDDAADYFEQALSLNPDLVESRKNLEQLPTNGAVDLAR